MPTKSIPLTQVVHNLFSDLETVLDMGISGSTVAQRFDNFEKICNTSHNLRQIVGRSVRGNESTDPRIFKERLDALDFSDFRPEHGLNEEIIRLLFSIAIRSTFKPSRSVKGVLKQHWIPMCIMRQWGIEKPDTFNGMGNVQIIELDNRNGTISQKLLDARRVVHQPELHECAYTYFLEDFFGHFECRFGNTLKVLNIAGSLADSKGRKFPENPLSVFDAIMLFSFVMMNEFRKPDAHTGEFSMTTIGEFMQKFCEILEATPIQDLKIVSSSHRMPFTMVNNPQLFQNADGIKIKVFPLTPYFSFVSSDGEITQSESERVVARHRAVTLDLFRKRSVRLYGLSEDHL